VGQIRESCEAGLDFIVCTSGFSTNVDANHQCCGRLVDPNRRKIFDRYWPAQICA
jgi:hypothetical protein